MPPPPDRGLRLLRAAPAAALALVLLGTPPASAGPTERLRDFFAAVNTILADPEIEDEPLERVARIRGLVAEIADVNEAAAVALGREWRARSPAERDEFVAIFAELLERAYVGRLAGTARVSNGVQIAYLGESVAGDEATVQTTLGARDGGMAVVDYRMVSRQGRWRVRDLVLDGVSIVENYRAQFRRILRQVSYPGLLGKVKAKLGEASIMFARVGGWSAAAREPSPTELVLIVRLDDRTTDGDRQPPVQIPRLDDRTTDHDRQPSIVPATLTEAESPVARAVAPARSSEDGWSVGAATAREKGSASAAIKKTLTGPAGTAPARSAALAASYRGQAGAFTTATAAGRLAERLSKEAVVSSVSGRLMPVCVAPFAQRTEAVSKLRALAAIGYRPFITGRVTEPVPSPREARRPHLRRR